MGRRFPIGGNQLTYHTVLSYSLLFACIAASVAIISSLCGSLLRKKSNPPSHLENKTTEDSNRIVSSRNSTTETSVMPLAMRPAELEGTTERVQPRNEEVQQPLPLPPRMSRLRAASYHFQSSSTASERKLSSSMSMRLQQGGAMLSRQSSRRENFDRKREKKLKHEDSIWKKTIILGEKCRVPDEDDAVVCDEKGHMIPTYHRKIPSLFSVSRQTSGIDPDAISR